MAKNKYSRIYKVDTFQFRYNYEEQVLEYITTTDIDFDENDKPIVIKLETPQVIDATGLSVDNWKDGPGYWTERYADELREELRYMTEGI